MAHAVNLGLLQVHRIIGRYYVYARTWIGWAIDDHHMGDDVNHDVLINQEMVGVWWQEQRTRYGMT